MNKIAALLILLIPIISLAQLIPEDYNAEFVINDLQLYLQNRDRLAGRPGIELKGSPFLFDDFRQADLYFTNKSRALNRSVKFNCYTDEIYYLDKGILYSIEQSIIDMFIIRSAADTTSVIFRNIFLDSRGKRSFLQVLYEGNIIFYKRHHKEFIEADYTGPYNPDRRYDEYIDKPRYYIQMGDGTLHKLKLNEKYMVRLFSDRSEEVGEFINSNGIRLSEERELVRLAVHYDQLDK